jgi:transcriptional regulator with GAF, ATPase, and Fis domain
MIALFNTEKQALYPTYYVDQHGALPDAPYGDPGPAGYVFEHQKTLCCTPKEFKELMPGLSDDDIVGAPPKIWLGVPLSLNNEVFGVMAVQDYENDNVYGPAEQEFFERLSPAIAATIVRRQAESELSQTATVNERLFTAARLLNASFRY